MGERGAGHRLHVVGGDEIAPAQGSQGEEPSAIEECSREVELINKYGLHARPATLIAQSAKTFKCEVVLIKGDELAENVGG